MEKEKIARINALANNAKTEGLTDAEREEQAQLRKEYVAEFRAQFTGILDHTVIQYPDGSREKLNEKKKTNQ